MFAIKIIGKGTGAEFVLEQTYPTKAEAEKVVAKMADANKASGYVEREIIEV